jgi:hypothetical protein
MRHDQAKQNLSCLAICDLYSSGKWKPWIMDILLNDVNAKQTSITHHNQSHNLRTN